MSRIEDVVEEYQKAAKSWDTTRARLTEENTQLIDDLRVSEALVRRLLEDRESADAEARKFFNGSW